ncbi:LamG domain-containing protein, partial [Candidatus Gracilibacteria bacterium]|nr:LamG domain-containing protein [Candidatus Gracilibacteria bacterium]
MVYSKDGVYVGAVRYGYFQYAFGNDWDWRGDQTFPVSNGVWYHALVTYDGSKQKLYRNGALVYQRNHSGNIPNNSEPLLLGKRSWYGGTSYFDGQIDEFKLYDKALGNTKIQEIYANENNGKNFDGTVRTPIVCTPPPPPSSGACTENGLTAYWSFNEGSGNTALDNYGSHDGVLYNSPTWTTGIASNALSFNDNDYIQPASNNGLSTESYSLSLWAKLDSTSCTDSWKTMFEQNRWETGHIGMFIRPSNCKPHFRNRGHTFDANIDISDGTWHHLVFTYEQGNKTAKIYIDGNLDATATNVSHSTGNNKTTRIGRNNDGGETFPGSLDEVRLYDRALNSSEVSQLYSTPSCSTTPPKLVAEYRFDECSWDGTMGDVKDSNDNLFHGTSKNSADTLVGKLNRAAKFYGNAYALVNDDEILRVGEDNKDFALTFWMKLEESHTGSWRRIIQKGNGQKRTFAMWMRPNDNRIHYRISTTGAWNDGGDSIQSVSVDSWTHIAYVKVGDKLKLFINGIEDSEDTLNGDTVSNNENIIIGDGTSLELDEYKLFTGTLSNDLIKDIYDNENAGKNWDGTSRTAVVCTPPPTLYISNEETTEGDSGSKNLEFTVSLDADAGSGVTFDYQVFDGNNTEVMKNATAPSDHSN